MFCEIQIFIYFLNQSGTWRFSVQLILDDVPSKSTSAILDHMGSHVTVLTTQQQMLGDQPFQLFIELHSTQHTTPFKKCSSDLGSQTGQGPSGFMLLPCVKMMMIMMIMITYDYSIRVINQRRLVILKAFSWMKILELRLIFHWSLFVMFQLTKSQNWLRHWIGAEQVARH